MSRFSTIPRVRLWRIRLEDGRVFDVQGPTRYLAILNLRAAPSCWGAVKSATVRRSVKSLSGLPMVAQVMGTNPAKA